MGATDGHRLALAERKAQIPSLKEELSVAYVGRLADEDMVRLNRAVLVFLGIAAPTGL